MKEPLPPYLDQYYANPGGGRWVGTSDPHAPQLAVEGPPLTELREHYGKAASVILYFTSRTADMDLEDPDDVAGEIAVEIRALFEEAHGTVNFLASTGNNFHRFLRNVDVWVWDYDGERGGADFKV